MKHLTHSRAEGRARRARYCELRRQGVEKVTAAAAVGVHEPTTMAKYERWFRALESGAEIVPGRLGRWPGGKP